MSQRPNNILRKRQTLGGVSGSVIVTNTSPTATALVQNTAAGTDGSATGIQLASSTPSPSPTSSSPASAATTSPSSSSANNISLSTVIGACVGAFIVLVLVISLAIHCSRRQKPQRRGNASQSRNATNNLSRRRSHLQPWDRLDDDKEDQKDGPPLIPRPSSGPMEKLGAMFNRTPSTTSAEKSSDGHGNRESIGTMQHFAKYHPGLAEEMASKSAEAGYVVVTKPPPAQRFMGRTQADSVPTISWDGDTVGGESFLSVRSRLSGTMSPTMTMAKFTPPATVSGSHRWESAEVGHIDVYGSEMSEAGDSRNPFADAASVKSGVSRRVTNPFFNAQEKPQRRTLLANTTPESNPFADSHAPISRPFLEARSNSATDTSSNNSHAMQSLIAALDMSAEAGLRVASMRSSNYSHSSTIMSCDEIDAVSVTAFPYPPTQVPLG
ncbi:hypothetical protein DEU56DRAFT_291796 [Suillus clintonianus]|uniref:uncharacterized protein n=1 Tax=Suillus clintonianus TaxID=1904413 RepID=UPI001B871A23|nr:uncharacterized protein DEU56DRAFT_291796 [Suillus clintonianus]KAG2140072.1 hypothetical protein DEU56DRAFT_291796 [Suillus clintonianus]